MTSSPIVGNNIVYTGPQLINTNGHFVERIPTANSNDTLPSAIDLIDAFIGQNSSANIGQNVTFMIYNNSSYTINLYPGTDITFKGVSYDVIYPQSVKSYMVVQSDVSQCTICTVSDAPVDPTNFSVLSLASGKIFVGNNSNVATAVSMSGDATLDNTGELTLSNTGVSAGTYSLAGITVNSKGRITSANTANLTGAISSVGTTTSVTSQTGTGSTFVMNTSPTLITPNIGVASASSLNMNSGIISNLGNPTTGTDATNAQYTNYHIVYVGTQNSQYSSITSALASITDASSSNPYVIHVGPGIYVESNIQMKTGVFILGAVTGSTIVTPSSASDTIFIGADGALLKDLFISGATSGIGVSLEGTTGAGMLIRDCGFANNNIHIKVYGNSSSVATVMTVDRCSVTGNCTKVFDITNNVALSPKPSVRFTTELIQFTNLTSLTPVQYVYYVSGQNIIITCQNLITRVGTSSLTSPLPTAFYVDNGAEFRVTSSTVKGYDTVLYVPPGSPNPPMIYIEGIIANNIVSNYILIENNSTIGYWNGDVLQTLVTIPLEAPFYITDADKKNITVSQTGDADFTSIKQAVDSITDASAATPYIVTVGPGVYYEDEIVIPAYVSIKGSSINTTVVSPNVPNQNMFLLGSLNEISFLTIQGIPGSTNGGPGTGYAAINCTDSGDYTQLHKISIYDFDIGIYHYANTVDCILYVEYTDINGDYTYAINTYSDNGFSALSVLEDFFTFPSTSTTKTAINVDGTGATVQITGCILYGGTGMTGVALQNGSNIIMNAVLLKDFLGVGVVSKNIGAGQSLEMDGVTFNNTPLNFSIENTGTTGYFFGNSPSSNHYIILGSPFYIVNRLSNTVYVAKKGGDFTSIKAAVDSILDSSALNPYVVSISPGIFVEDTITLSPGILIQGQNSDATYVMASSPTNTVFVGADSSCIKDVHITGASGVGGRAITMSGTVGNILLVRDCGFSNNNVHIETIGNNTAVTLIYVDRCTFVGTCDKIFLANSNPGNQQTRILTSLIVQSNLTALQPLNYVYYIDGPNIVVTVQNLVARIGTTSLVSPLPTVFYVNNGSIVRVTSSSIRGYNTILHVPSGSPDINKIYINSLLFDEIGDKIILIESANTQGFWDCYVDYTKVSIPDNCSFFINNKNSQIITVYKTGGDFTSIVSAIASITDNSTNKRYIIQVGPGTYVESAIHMKPYVTVQGSGISTIIQSDSPNHHVVYATEDSEIDSCIITGAGTGYAAIYCSTASGTSTTFFNVNDITFGENDILCWADGSGGTHVNIIVFNCVIGTYQFNTGFKATNNDTLVEAHININASTSNQFISPFPDYVLYTSGQNCRIYTNSLVIESEIVEANTVGGYADNGARLHMTASSIAGFATGISVPNNGVSPDLVLNSVDFKFNTTDINIQHPTVSGSLNVTADKNKIIINNSPPISIFVIDDVNTGTIMTGPMYYSPDEYTNITDISDLITKDPTMGINAGGIISHSNILEIEVSSGTGYVTVSNIVKQLIWTTNSLIVPASSNVYIFINSNTVLSYSASYPNNVENIILGQVSTDNTDIIYIQNTRLIANNWTNYSSNMLRNAIGPIFDSGCTTTAIPASLTFQVTQGSYYYSTINFLPGGQNPVTFTKYYRSFPVSNPYTSDGTTTTVPNAFYDDGSGTLAAVTAGYYTKHLIVMLGGPSESYALIYAQAEYSTSGAAEAAGLPISPSFVNDAFVNIASIVVQQGNTSIVTIIDERPRIGFASSSVTGTVTNHGDLTGLAANDHPQYLLVNGGAPGMTGDLDMNTNDIIDVGLINSIDIALHGSRHGLNASDPVPTPILASAIQDISGTAASLGISNEIPRADHVHFHGNLAGGSLHANVIASGASGFMTGTDKAKLDTIQSGATNTTPSDLAPLNVTKATASAGVSAEVSRYDHKHDVSTAAPITTLLTTTTNAEGSATSLARSDHTHAISSDVPITIIPDQANAIGNSTAFSRADHVHNIATASAVGLNANSTSTTGAGNNFARASHTHAIASGVPSNQTIAVAVQTGTSTNFARADHIHTFSTDVPVSIGSTNTEGSSTSFARADHIHNITLTGPITSTGTTTAVASQTGTGSTFVMNTGPTITNASLVTPNIGVASGTSLTTSGALRTATSLIIEDPGVGTNTITLQAPTLASSYVLTFPIDDGLSGQILSTDGSGVLTWIDPNIGAVTSVSGTTNRITSTGGTTPVIDISASYVGQTSITTLGTVATGTWNGNVITGQYGGTGVANTGRTITVGGNFVTNDSVTIGSTATINQLFYISSANNLSGLASANSAVLVTSSTGAPTFSSSMTNGQLIIGSSGATPVTATLTQGTGISITNGAGTITISTTGLVSSVSGTTNRITSTGGTTPVIDIAATYVGQTSITTLGTITSGTWNSNIISSVYGGTGVNNGANTITLAGNFITSGAFSTTLTSTNTTNVILPTTGTLATTSQLPTPSALTKVDDTNVTLTLSGTPSTALLQPTTITAGWTGQLPLTRGGTNASLTASDGGIFYSTSTAAAILSGTATANQVLLSGLSSAPSWSLATYPSSTTINGVLYSSANNVISEITTANSSTLITNGSGVPSWNNFTGPELTTYFGDGSDGTLTTSMTFSRDMYFTDVTLSTGDIVITNGYRMFVRGTLDLTTADAGAIRIQGKNGNDANLTTIGTTVLVSQSRTIGGGIGNGGAGGAANGGNGGNGGVSNIVQLGGNSRVGGAGGAGGAAGGAGGAVTSSPLLTFSRRLFSIEMLFGNNLMIGGQGGGGGGGGGSATSGAGGSGATGGGTMFISANRINRSGTTAVGAISTKGGNGGNGGNATAGANRGGGGGGSGGGGGFVYIAYGTLLGSTATDAIDVSGGNGGTGGAGTNGGTGGTGGGAAGAGQVYLLNLVTGTGNYTSSVAVVPIAGSAGTVPNGGAGATATVVRVSL